MRTISFFVVFSVCCGLAWGDDTVRLTNGEWPPFLSKYLKHYGVVSRIVTESFASEGIRTMYTFFPWKRALESARSGKWDGSVVWTYKEDRAMDFLFSDEVFKDTTVLFHLKSFSFEWTSGNWTDLKGIPIGATLGYDYGQGFVEAEKSGKLHIERVASDEMNFGKLLFGRIRIFPMSRDGGYWLLHNKFTPEEREMLTYTMYDEGVPCYLILSKNVEKNKARLELFNRGLKKLRENGNHEKYFEESRRGEYNLK